MRVAYVCADPGVPVFGRKGCSVHVQEVIRAMREEGAEVELFASRFGGNPTADLKDIRCRELPCVRQGAVGIREQAALRANPELSRVLHSAGGFDLIYERHSLWSYSGMEYAKQEQIPGLLEVNAPLIQEQAAYRELVHADQARVAVSRAFNAASALLAVSTNVATYLYGEASAGGRVHVVPNGVDLKRFNGKLHSGSEHFTIGFVGTLKPWHGIETLIAAFRLCLRWVPNARLLLVGDGPERSNIELEIARLGLTDVVTLTGAVTPEEIPSLLASMDVAVAPYPPLRDFYFSPLKVYEYMAAGCAIVASAVGQIDEVLKSGQTALLCPPGAVAVFASAFRTLHDCPELGNRLGRNARDAVAAHHTWESVVRRILLISASSTSEHTNIKRVG